MIDFLTPMGWLVLVAAALPIAATILRGRRDAAVRSRIGLARPGRAAYLATAGAGVLAVALVAAATARPAVQTKGTRNLRTDAQVFFVVDVSRSMLARLPRGATRYSRAVGTTERLRAALASVPSGLASLTDRPLPHLFPTGNNRIFTAVLHRSIGIQRPPPEAGRNVYGLATSFDPLAQLGSAGYFGATARHRLAILLTDGESNIYAPARIARALRAEHVRLLVVRFWNARDRVYTAAGRIEPYRPERTALEPLERLAAGTGGAVYDPARLPALLRAARAWLGHGPTRPVGTPSRVELAPYLALAAVLPVAFVLRRRDP
jgi:hypothetical protein